MYIHTKGIQTTHGEIWNNKKFIFSFLYAESRIVVCVYNILYSTCTSIYLTDGGTVGRCRHVHMITDSMDVPTNYNKQ